MTIFCLQQGDENDSHIDIPSKFQRAGFWGNSGNLERVEMVGGWGQVTRERILHFVEEMFGQEMTEDTRSLCLEWPTWGKWGA